MAETEQKPARGRRVARRRRQGVACRNGYVVFVAGALPGDTVRAAINPGRVPLSMQRSATRPLLVFVGMKIRALEALSGLVRTVG